VIVPETIAPPCIGLVFFWLRDLSVLYIGNTMKGAIVRMMRDSSRSSKNLGLVNLRGIDVAVDQFRIPVLNLGLTGKTLARTYRRSQFLR
jgi:hypothetical protein